MSAPSHARIAYLCHEYPKHTETFVYREIDRMREMGAEIAVFAMKRPTRPEAVPDVAEKISKTGYLAPDFSLKFMAAQAAAFLRTPFKYVKLLLQSLFAGRERSVMSLRVRLGMFLRGAVAARMLTKDGGIGQLHCPATGDELHAAYVASVLSGLPLSFTLHSPLALFTGSRLLAKQARHASLIAAISEYTRRCIVELAGEEVEERVEIIRCGVDMPAGESGSNAGVKVGEGPLRMLSVGSLWLKKGHDTLIRAIDLLKSRGVDIYCDIIGEGHERRRLESLIEELGVSDRVKLLGSQPPEKVRERIKGARFFVLACRVDDRMDQDGVPVALMEAMSHGLPCVSTRVAGIGELVIDGQTGFLVEPDDPEALADAIQKLLDNPELAEKMGQKGRERVEKSFSLDEGTKRLKFELERLTRAVAYISHEYPKITETFVEREIEAFRKAGLRVKVYSLHKPRAGKSRLAQASGVVYLPSAMSPSLFMVALPTMLKSPLRAASLMSRAVSSMGAPGTWRSGWGGALDVIRGAWLAGVMGREVRGIHGSFAGVAANCAWAAGRLAKLPFGFSSHSSPPDPLLADKCREASWIFSESEFDKVYLAEWVGKGDADPSAMKISVIRCGLDPHEWPEPDWGSSRYASGAALFVGTLGPKKGVGTLMEAMALLKKEGVAAPEGAPLLEIVGDGPELERMKSILERCGASDMVRFMGEMPLEELMGVYRRARFMVLPSTVTPEGDRDGIPVTLLEAMASGMACISSPVSGIPELVEDDETGLLVPPGDAGALARAIVSLWKNPELCVKMGKASREKVFKNHNFTTQAAQIASIMADMDILE